MLRILLLISFALFGFTHGTEFPRKGRLCICEDDQRTPLTNFPKQIKTEQPSLLTEPQQPPQQQKEQQKLITEEPQKELAPQDELNQQKELVPKEDQTQRKELVPKDEQTQQKELVPKDEQTQQKELVPKDEQTQQKELVPQDEQTQQKEIPKKPKELKAPQTDLSQQVQQTEKVLQEEQKAPVQQEKVIVQEQKKDTAIKEETKGDDLHYRQKQPENVFKQVQEQQKVIEPEEPKAPLEQQKLFVQEQQKEIPSRATVQEQVKEQFKDEQLLHEQSLPKQDPLLSKATTAFRSTTRSPKIVEPTQQKVEGPLFEQKEDVRVEQQIKTDEEKPKEQGQQQLKETELKPTTTDKKIEESNEQKKLNTPEAVEQPQLKIEVPINESPKVAVPQTDAVIGAVEPLLQQEEVAAESQPAIRESRVIANTNSNQAFQAPATAAGQPDIANVVKKLNITEECVSCICTASSNCASNLVCVNDDSTCGPFQISYNYWYEAGFPGYQENGIGFRECAVDKKCAETTTRNYLTKFAVDCNGDGIINCIDFAFIHKFSAKNCNNNGSHLTSSYWSRFKTCYGVNRR